MTVPATLEGVMEAHGHHPSPAALDAFLSQQTEGEWFLRAITAAHIRGETKLPEEMYELAMHFLYGMDWMDIEWPRFRLMCKGQTLRGPTGMMSDLIEAPAEELQDRPLLIVSADNEGNIHKRHKRWHKKRRQWVNLTS